MPRVNLTNRFVSGVRSDTRQNYFDQKTAGLALRQPRGDQGVELRVSR